MRPLTTTLRTNRRYLLLAVLLLAALYVLVPQFGEFRSSWHLLRHPAVSWTILAVGLTALTYLVGAATYCILAFKPLAYGQTAVVQLAAMLINRLLPGGIGALGVNYAYLRRRRHSSTQAATVVALNNIIGFLGHGLLVAVGLIFLPGHAAAVSSSHNRPLGLVVKFMLGVLILLAVIVLVFGRRRFLKAAVEARYQFLSYRRRPWRLAAALASSMVLTLSNVTCLLCCALAVGVHLPFVAVLLIFTLGIGAGTATPTPGGLGGFEAGLTAGFIAYQVGSPAALAAALLYRLVSYWLPLLAGVPALIFSQKRELFAD